MTKKNDRNLIDINTGILDTENEIYSQNDKGINITASGSTIRVVNVTAYNAYTNLGDGTLQIGGGAITYTNGTGVYLVAGDVVAVATDTSGNNVAVAIISRSGSSTAGSGVPIVYPSADFPIHSDTLVFPIQEQSGGGPSFASDMSGGLGLGADTIIGYNSGATSINAFNRSTATSSSLYANPTNPNAYPNIYVTSYGRVIKFQHSTPSPAFVTVYYKDAGSLSWTTETFSGPNGTCFTTYDYTTETVWLVANTSPSGGVRYLKLGPTDSSFVDCGNLGITAASSSTYYQIIIANNGSLVLFTNTIGSTTSDIYMKFSGDNSNFTKYGTFAQASFPLGNSGITNGCIMGSLKKYDVTTLGAVTQMIAVSGQLYYYRLNLNGSVDALPTGIPTTTTGFRYENHLNLHSREYPLLQIICREVDIMPGGSTSYVAVIATFDPTTVSVPPYTATPYYLFYDATNQLRANPITGSCAPLQEVSTNKVRTLWANTGATYLHALNEITVL